jgi:serine/threonine protein kinase
MATKLEKILKLAHGTNGRQNVVRMLWVGNLSDMSMYIAFERYGFSLHDLFAFYNDEVQPENTKTAAFLSEAKTKIPQLGNNGGFSSEFMCVIRDTIKGVSELHELNILHQQLHLEHILVTLDGRLRVKISGFSKSTHVPGDEKLESLAPGTIEGQRLLLDLSQLGWLLFHCFTFGQHISNRFLQESDLHFPLLCHMNYYILIRNSFSSICHREGQILMPIHL